MRCPVCNGHTEPIPHNKRWHRCAGCGAETPASYLLKESQDFDAKPEEKKSGLFAALRQLIGTRS